MATRNHITSRGTNGAGGEDGTGVDRALLTETGSGGVLSAGYLRDRPLVEYLDDDEHPQFLLSNAGDGVERTDGDGTTRHAPGDGYRAIAAVTDAGVRFVVGGAADADGGGDRTFAVPHAEVEGVEAREGWLTNELLVETREGTEWRFHDGSGTALTAVAEYVERAAHTWARVERQLGEAGRIVDGMDEGVDGDERVTDARERAEARLSAAREAVATFDPPDGSRLRTRVREAEAELERARLRANVSLGEHLVDLGDERRERGDYARAHETYTDARERFEAARRIADDHDHDHDRDHAAAAENGLDRVRTRLDRLSGAPLRRAREARDRAAAATDDADAVDRWEEALDRFRTALAFEWGDDDARFEGDRGEIEGATAAVVDELVDTRESLAGTHRRRGNWYYAEGQYDRAREHYVEARDHLDRALSLTREYGPGRADELETARDDVCSRLDDLAVSALADAPDGFAVAGSDVDGSDSADDTPFRGAVARVLGERGWTVAPTVAPDDRGYDLVAARDDADSGTLLVRTVDRPAGELTTATVNRCVAVRADEDADAVALVTSGTVPDRVADHAAVHDVALVGSEDQKRVPADHPLGPVAGKLAGAVESSEPSP